MPGWQKPHCSAAAVEGVLDRVDPAAAGGEVERTEPLDGRDLLPWASAARVRQASTGAPSTRTVHAPQSPLSQPCLEPAGRAIAKHFEERPVSGAAAPAGPR